MPLPSNTHIKKWLGLAAALLLTCGCPDSDTDIEGLLHGDETPTEAARRLCQERTDSFDSVRAKQISALQVGLPDAQLPRNCLFIEMWAALPEAERAGARAGLAKFSREIISADDWMWGPYSTEPTWLSHCPSAVGPQTWGNVWRFASVDLEASSDATVQVAPMELLRAMCPAGHARDGAGGRVGSLSALAPRLAEAHVNGGDPARWPLVELLARLWAHSDGRTRQRLAPALAGAGPALWPALEGWRDGLREQTAPLPASVARHAGGYAFDAEMSAAELLARLPEQPAVAQGRRFSPPGRGHGRGSAAADAADVWDNETRGDRQTGGEFSQSVIAKEGTAERSAARLLAQFGLGASDLDRFTREAVAGVAALLDDVEAGRRSDAPLRAAHPDIGPAQRLQVARMVLGDIERWSRYSSGDGLLGHRALVLAWLAIRRFDGEPDAGSPAAAARDRELMADSLLRNLAESVYGGPTDGHRPFTTACPAGTGARAIRSLQGFYRVVAVDTEIVEPLSLFGALGETFTRRHPEPTAAQVESFIRAARRAGEDMYVGHPRRLAAFTKLLEDYRESLE